MKISCHTRHIYQKCEQSFILNFPNLSNDKPCFRGNGFSACTQNDLHQKSISSLQSWPSLGINEFSSCFEIRGKARVELSNRKLL